MTALTGSPPPEKNKVRRVDLPPPRLREEAAGASWLAVGKGRARLRHHPPCRLRRGPPRSPAPCGRRPRDPAGGRRVRPCRGPEPSSEPRPPDDAARRSRDEPVPDDLGRRAPGREVQPLPERRPRRGRQPELPVPLRRLRTPALQPRRYLRPRLRPFLPGRARVRNTRDVHRDRERDGQASGRPEPAGGVLRAPDAE